MDTSDTEDSMSIFTDYLEFFENHHDPKAAEITPPINEFTSLYQNASIVLKTLHEVDRYEVALEGLMTTWTDDEDVNDILAELQEMQTREQFLDSLNRLMVLLNTKKEVIHDGSV